MDVQGKMINCVDFDLEDDTITEQTHAKEIGNEKGKLVIQSIGVVVLEFLDKHFTNLFEYGYTREMEAKLDNISSGEYEWTELCRSSVNDMRELGNEVTTEIGMDKFEYQIDDKYTYMIGKYGPVIRYKNEPLKKKGVF
jgi:DNA topoisomerase-1